MASPSFCFAKHCVLPSSFCINHAFTAHICNRAGCGGACYGEAFGEVGKGHLADGVDISLAEAGDELTGGPVASSFPVDHIADG